MNILLKTLKRGKFWPLFGAQGFGALNDNIFKTALATYIVFRLPSFSPAAKSILSPLALGLLMLPYFLFSALAGEVADRFRKSVLVKIYKVTELVIMFLGAMGFVWGNPYFLLLIIFLIGVQAAFFGPVKYSLLPENLPENELIAGNGLIEGATFIAIVVGSLIGGVLASLFPHAQPFSGNHLVAAVIIAVAMLGLWCAWQLPPSSEKNDNLPLNPKIWQSTYQIIQSARKNRTVWLCILGLSWFWLLGGMFLSLLPLLIQQVMNGSPAIYNLLLTTFAVGVGIGSLSCHWVLKGRISIDYVPWAAIVMAILMIDLAFLISRLAPAAIMLTLWDFLGSVQGWHLTANLFLISVFGGFYAVPQNTILQYIPPPGEISRIVAANNIVNALFMSAASIFAAIFMAMGGHIKLIFAALTIGSILVASLSLLLLPHLLARGICVAFLRFFYNVQVKGREHVSNIEGAALIISNHTSFLDSLLMVGFIPRKIIFAIDKKWASKAWLRPVLYFVKILPIDPENPIAARTLIEELASGNLVVIFPEGRLTATGNIMKIYDGTSLIVDKTKVPIICAHIRGGEYTIFGRFRRKLPHPPRKQLALSFYPPEELKIPETVTGKQRRAWVSDTIYHMMRRAAFDACPTGSDIWSIFKNTVAEQGKRRNAIYDDTSSSVKYGAIQNRAKILGYFISKTSYPGENIGILMPNVSITVILFLALSSIGRVPAMLNYSQGSGPMKSALQTGKIQQIYTSREFLKTAGLLDTVSQLPVTVIYLEDLHISLLDKIRGYFFSVPSPHPDQPAAILFTSGSEGAPKAVVLSHKNILSNLYQHACCVDFNEKDTLFNALPMFHAFGLNTGTLVPLICGAKVVLFPNPLHIRAIPEIIYQQDITVIIGTNTFLRSWGQKANPYDFYHVRYIFSGGERVTNSTTELFFQKFGHKIYEGYGVTEASPVLTVNTPMHNRAGTTGRFLERIEYRLQPLEGLAANDKGNIKGILLIKGPNIMLGYLDSKKPGQIKKAEDGWYNTGDIVSVDEEGYVTVEGRRKRFAKIGGEMVSLEAVESVAHKVWPEINLAVLSFTEGERGEKLVLVAEQKNMLLGELWQEMKEQGFSKIAWPGTSIHIDPIPLTPLGKINYPALENLITQK